MEDYTLVLINMSCKCVRLRIRPSKNIGQMANFELSQRIKHIPGAPPQFL